MKFSLLALIASSFLLCESQPSLLQNISCPKHQTLDPNNLCIEPTLYIEGCSKYKSTSSCASCFSSTDPIYIDYQLIENICVFNKQTVCCTEKDHNGKCIKCHEGLWLNSDGLCESETIVGCLDTLGKGECTNCVAGWQLIEGKCQLGIKYCVDYGESNDDNGPVCSKCKKNYSLINNFCLQNKILGCESESSHTCHSCHKPFILTNSHCEIKNCLSYNDFGCTSCECGFYLTPKSTCEKIQPGCIRYQRGICTDCHEYFTLRGGVCVMEGCKKVDFLSCEECEEGFVKEEGVCKLSNCLLNENKICLVCENGFYLKNGECFERNENNEIKS